MTLALRGRAFEFVTFDCYGTIVDWERGILAELRAALGPRGAPTDQELLDAFAAIEPEVQRERPTARYPDVLAAVFARLAARFGFAGDGAAFGASVGRWPPFADSADALRALRNRGRIGVLSNIDRASFAATQQALGVEFDAVWTAEEIGSYKPDLRNFEFMLARLAEVGVSKDRVLHCAESRFHDIAPCRRLDITCVWVDRRAGRGAGASGVPVGAAEPDARVESLAELADLLGA